MQVKTLQGEFVTVRALIDQGSQITSISEDVAQLLQLPKKKTEIRLPRGNRSWSGKVKGDGGDSNEICKQY